jgi:hypothetical protein
MGRKIVKIAWCIDDYLDLKHIYDHIAKKIGLKTMFKSQNNLI